MHTMFNAHHVYYINGNAFYVTS